MVSQDDVPESDAEGGLSPVGVSRVLVTDILLEGSGAAHSLQNLESEGLSVSHFGHLIATVYP
jgi:hypothetical protein